MSPTDARQRILAANQEAADAIRHRFADAGTLVVNLISSPGSGKTSLIESTVPRLAGRWKIGAIEGDIATERDAQRLRQLGIPAHQILTNGACHLDARMVLAALDRMDFSALDLLIIENVGNLVCPTSYDLGEDFKVALLSVTEGEDKPFKYPGIFSRAAVTVITKMDLLPHVSFSLGEVSTQINTLNRDARIVVTSVRTGEGLDAWTDLLRVRLESKRATLV